MHEVLVNGLGGLSLPRESVVRLTDRPDMTFDVYRGRKTTIQYNTSLFFVFVQENFDLISPCTHPVLLNFIHCILNTFFCFLVYFADSAYIRLFSR